MVFKTSSKVKPVVYQHKKLLDLHAFGNIQEALPYSILSVLAKHIKSCLGENGECDFNDNRT